MLTAQKLYVFGMAKHMENIQNKNVCYLHENCMDFFRRERNEIRKKNKHNRKT